MTELNCGAFVSEVELFVFKLFPIFKHDSRSDWSVMYSDENGKCTKGKVGFVTIRWQIVFKTRDESIQRQVLHKKPIYSTFSFSFRDDVGSRSFSRGFHGCSLAMLLFLGLLHFHSGSFHRSNYLFFALFFEPFLFLFIDRIGTVFVLFAIVGLIALLAEKVFVCKFDAVNRVT